MAAKTNRVGAGGRETSGAFSSTPSTKAMVMLLVRNEPTMPMASIASPTSQ